MSQILIMAGNKKRIFLFEGNMGKCEEMVTKMV